MALMERVALLVRANLNDLIDRAEDPETMLKQVMLDLRNQQMQVKTQVAMALADQHLLTGKRKERDEETAGWRRKAELALGEGEEGLARQALERSLVTEAAAEGFRRQLEQQSAKVEDLKTALRNLESKLVEARSQCEVLAARQRRARLNPPVGGAAEVLDRVGDKVGASEALSQGQAEVSAAGVEDRLAAMERADRVDRLLAELKAKRG